MRIGSLPRSFGDFTIVGADSSQPDLDEGHVGREKLRAGSKKPFQGKISKSLQFITTLVSIPLAGRENTVLVDAGDVLELLNRCKVNLVLCGHCPIPWVWHLNNMLVVNAGTICSSKTRDKTTQSYNLIQAEKENSGENWKVWVLQSIFKG